MMHKAPKALRDPPPVHDVVNAFHVHTDNALWQRQVQAKKRIQGFHHNAPHLPGTG
jgi:hypothetical protein